MKKILLFGILLAAAAPTLRAQSVGPLHQVLSSNSLINRPIVLRDLQFSIRNEFGDVKPGANLELLYDKMSQVRKDLLALIEQPEMKYSESDNTVTIRYLAQTISLNIGLSPNEAIFTLIHARMASVLSGEISTILNKVPANQRQGIISQLINSLEKSGFNPPDSLKVAYYPRRLANTLVFGLLDNFKKEIRNRHPEIDPDSLTSAEILVKIEKTFNKISEQITNHLREQVSTTLDAAEHEIATVVDEFSNFLLSANAGLAVTEGPEGFSGGLLLQYVWSSKFQTGLYVNGQFSGPEKDSTSVLPERSLVGAQLRFAGDAVQLDLLGSALFGSRGFKFFEVFEIGAGLSYRCGTSFIVGLEGFWLHAMDSNAGLGFEDVVTAGVSFKGASANAPSILVGITAQNGSKKPVFQFSFPILARN